jgi:hypothetical protein
MVFNEKILIEFAYLSLFINAFNLLPIVPLDGGHFLNETLFNRFPKAELAFKILAIIGLGLLSYFFRSWIFGLIAFFMLFTLGVSYKMAEAASSLRQEDGMKGSELTVEKIGRIREMIREANPHFESERNIKRLPNVVNGMWNRINKIFPSIPTTVFLLVAYVVVGFGFSTFTLGFIHGATKGELVQQDASRDADAPRE